jgi:hypothetical protein
VPHLSTPSSSLSAISPLSSEVGREDAGGGWREGGGGSGEGGGRSAGGEFSVSVERLLLNLVELLKNQCPNLILSNSEARTLTFRIYVRRR